MAIGFSPKYTEFLNLNRYRPEHFLALAAIIADQSQWIISGFSNEILTAKTDNDRFNHNATIAVTIEDTLVRLESTSAGSEMMDFGRNKKNIQQFIDSFYQIKGDYSPEMLQEKYNELITADFLEAEDINEDTEEIPNQKFSFNDWKSVAIPTKGYMITPILIYLNVLIFILMVCLGADFIKPSLETLCNWGANYRPFTTNGQWWRLLSSCFLHSGLFHLLFNMAALAYIGIMLEPKFGKVRFFSAYLLTGIAASSVSLWWNIETVSVGASGAIFGMYGVFLALLTTNFVSRKTRTVLFTSIGVFVLYNLIGGSREGIDNAAHIGGLISGILIGYALVPSLKKPEANILKFATISIMSAMILLASFGFSRNISDDRALYKTKMDDFIEMEAMALAIYRNYGYMNQANVLDEIKNRSTYYWNENFKITEEIKHMSLPQSFLIRNEKVREYCELHLKKNELIYKAVSEKTTQYEAEMQEYDRKINLVRAEITVMQ